MRVVLNGLAALKPKTGVGHHVADLTAALVAEFPTDAFTLYPGDTLSRWVAAANRGAAGGAHGSRPGLVKRLLGGVKSVGKTMAKAASGLHFAAYTRAFRFDLYHEPNFVPFRAHLPTVVTVHDLSVLKFPQWHPADRVKFHERHFLRGLGLARHVIVVSEAVRSELIHDLHCPPERVTTVHNGVGPQFVRQSPEAVAGTRRELGLPERFFLCVGTIEPRKNLGVVIRAFADLPSEVRSQCPLVLAGPWGWRSDEERMLFDQIGVPAGARHLGYVPSRLLPALYSAARVLLYPSHYEGFGLPPVEMLACGGAVIVSTDPAVREVVGRCGKVIVPDDVTGWRDAMREAANDDEFLTALSRGGVARSATFTWTRAARETMAVYRKVLGFPVELPTPSARAAA